MLLVDLSQQLDTHWFLIDLPQWLDTCWLLVGLPQQLAGHKVQICDTCSIGIKYCIRLKIWLLLFTLFKSLHLQNRCTNLTIIMLKSLIHNTDCMPFFFYEWRNRNSVQHSTDNKYHHLIASRFQNIQNVLPKRVKTPKGHCPGPWNALWLCLVEDTSNLNGWVLCLFLVYLIDSFREFSMSMTNR
jgi:hypothetical protein